MQKLLTTLIEQAEAEGVQRFSVGGIFMHQGRVLIVQRAADEDFLPNYWEIPGGGVDEGEDVLTGFYREMLEETGLQNFTISKLAGFFDYYSRAGHLIRQHNFVAEYTELPKVQLNPSEHQAFAWVEPNLAALSGYYMTDHAKVAIVSAVTARVS